MPIVFTLISDCMQNLARKNAEKRPLKPNLGRVQQNKYQKLHCFGMSNQTSEKSQT